MPPGMPRAQAPGATHRPHAARTRAAQQPAHACGACAAPHDSGYRRWPGWMPFYPLRLRFPDLTHSSSRRGQENSSSTEQHPARQNKEQKVKVKIKVKIKIKVKTHGVTHRTHHRGRRKPARITARNRDHGRCKTRQNAPYRREPHVLDGPLTAGAVRGRLGAAAGWERRWR